MGASLTRDEPYFDRGMTRMRRVQGIGTRTAARAFALVVAILALTVFLVPPALAQPVDHSTPPETPPGQINRCLPHGHEEEHGKDETHRNNDNNENKKFCLPEPVIPETALPGLFVVAGVATFSALMLRRSKGVQAPG